MKSQSRSHRLPISDPPDDWVDGSWTVDCICGVNFDDGEEMVNCDECGVWVHTRCSRYVKSEKLFACDKCKSKNSRNDSEETEVAQLLVELPTKTLRMGNPNPPIGQSGRPFRLWTDIPMEERVHVQGIPGGDPSLFGGLSSVFSPELWKCTGYVPKKFNFQYKEFSCWDGKLEEDGKKTDERNELFVSRTDEESENPANKGAGALFLLSKENVLPTHSATLVGTQRQVEESGRDWPVRSGVSKKREGEDLNVASSQNGVKTDRSSLHHSVIHSGKRKKDDMQALKDQSGKKRARCVNIEGDSKKRNGHACKTVLTLSNDEKRLEYEDRASKVDTNVKQSSKHGNSTSIASADPPFEGCRLVDIKTGNPENNVAFSCQTPVTLSCDLSTYNCSIEARPKQENGGHQVSAGLEISLKDDNGVQSSVEHTNSGSVPVKKEVGDIMNDAGGSSTRSEGIDPDKRELIVENMAISASQVKDNQIYHDSSCDMSLTYSHQVKAEVDSLCFAGAVDLQIPPPSGVKLDDLKPSAQNPIVTANCLSENFKVNNDAMGSSQSFNNKVEDVNKRIVADDFPIDKIDEAHPEPCLPMRQLVSSESSMIQRKSSSELKQGSRSIEEPSRTGDTVNASEAPSQRKVVVSFGKSSSTSSTVVISKPSSSDICRPQDAQNHNFSTKQRGRSDYNISGKKENASTNYKDRDGHERPKKIEKEHPKSSFSSVKTSNSSRIPHASVSRRTLSDSKESIIAPHSKTSFEQTITPIPNSGESASSLQSENALHVENKITASGLLQKSEKANQLNCQAPTKVNHPPPMQPPATSNSSATLSDEELALLLHQELNSSPRVPRVPRMRHAGSLPQLASPTGTGMLMKRTSSSGGKDHSSVSKRKGKDIAKEGSHKSQDLEDEPKVVDRLALLPNQRKHEISCTADPVTKGDTNNGSAKFLQSVNKSISRVSSLSTGTCSLASTDTKEKHTSSTRYSTLNASDDDAGTVVRPSHLTLPGLISEIMSKGKRMSYEELCNVVLPHWPHLRKHNGERYAYSSHSQAVLDCLRNRSEWAQLVDRGPKTNAGRKRRKYDAEAQSIESEDNECNKDRTGKDVESRSFESQRDEFPKGKRKARKRRRLALQGRGIKDVRRRHKDDVVSDDDIGRQSNSTEESLFSEDEIQGGGTCPGACEASSASSDEAGTMI